MFLVKAGTVIQIEKPKAPARSSCWDTAPWRPYRTTEDKLYDKHEVWDAVSVYNDDAGEIPEWARRNVREHGYTILKRAGKYAMVPSKQVTFLD
jgi:hypothetical protein